MNTIGGYFELELPLTEEYHKSAIRLNTGRNAFEYILRAKQYEKVYLPYYTCDVMLEPVKKLDLDFEFYNIDKNFVPVFDFSKVNQMDVFVYTNYFGICDKQVEMVSQKCKNLIIDNSQAFFSKPLSGVDTFYSARKFFGVSDGAYLYTDKEIMEDLKQDVSYQRFEHLLGRADRSAEEFYTAFKKNDDSLVNQPIKKMSKLTQKLMASIDYENIAQKRIQNFDVLHSALSKTNLLGLDLSSESVPMVYPYLIKSGEELKKQLINNKIFVATYWPNVKGWIKDDNYENNLYSKMLAMPIDQRYNNDDILKILKIIISFYNE
ncbi:MAG TPA: hypothetical protein PLY69_04755 [Bacteroidales bacterium]|nr:hypothetical protein [Bacteroidales bacterium]